MHSMKNHNRFSDLETRYNLNQLQKYECALNQLGKSLQQFSSILEFGCGMGRLTQYLFSLPGDREIFGCDVSDVEIENCRRRLPGGRFIKNNWCPPISFEADQFDLIYSYSVFTHLSEDNHMAWLKELSRLLKPGGIMMHTTHSYEYLKRIKMFSPSSLMRYSFDCNVESFMHADNGYYYAVDNNSKPEYGVTIINKSYILENWPRYSGLQVVLYLDGAIEAYPEGCQDIVVMSKDVT